MEPSQKSTDSRPSAVQIVAVTDPASLWPLLGRWGREVNGDGLGVTIVPQFVWEQLARMIAGPTSDVLGLVQDELLTGFIGVQMFVSPTGPQMMASEHYFYVAPEYRRLSSIRLIRAAQTWAGARGCARLLLTASQLASDKHDKVCRLYERLGAKKFETAYIIEVT